MFIICTTIFLFVGYSSLIIYYWSSWRSAPEFVAQNKSHQSRISLVIAARNEEHNIGRLLQALNEQTYPRDLTVLHAKISPGGFSACAIQDGSVPDEKIITLGTCGNRRVWAK